MNEMPHVVLFICDQMQYQRLGRVDPVAFTPNLDRFGDEGTFFTQHFSSNPQCVPSRVSMQTGLYPHEAEVMTIYGFHGHRRRLSRRRHRTLGQAFGDAGYTSAYFGKAHFGSPLEDLGYAVGREDAKGAGAVMRERDQASVDAAIELLGRYDPAVPLFLTVSVNEPHPPFELDERFADRYCAGDMAVPVSYQGDDLMSKPAFQREHAKGVHTYHDEDSLRADMRSYYTMISDVDRLFGLVRRALEEAGMWSDTVVAFTADHGDMMGAHRMRLKGTLPYDELFHIPLIIRAPRENAAAAVVVEEMGVNVALPSTLLELAGIEESASFPGGSLVPAMRGHCADSQERIYLEHYAAYWGVHPFRCVRSREWKYVHYYGPSDDEELYDLSSDPFETRNVAGDPSYDAVRSDLRDDLERWWNDTGGRCFDYYESPAFKEGD